MKNNPIQFGDLRGYGQLVADATLGVTGMVEAMHHTILRLPSPFGTSGKRSATGVHHAVYKVLQRSSGAVYGAIRQITRRAGGGVDTVLSHLQPLLSEQNSSPAREATLAIVNGVFGDHMQAHGNPLLITMSFRLNGRVLDLSKDSLSGAIAAPSGKVLVLLHGHCMNDLQWCRNGHNHGEALAAAHGFTPIYLRYNSGLHISQNGRALSELLEQLLGNWPVPVHELCIVGFSMGGLLARSAFHYAKISKHRWPQHVHKLFFVGTPHHGSMLEQAGNMVDKALEISPYSTALSRLGKIRSAGTTDLRHGNVVDEDWVGHSRFTHFSDQRTISPLPANVSCYAIAAMIGSEHGEVSARLIGDGLVPVPSALGQHQDAKRDLNIPVEHQRVFNGTSHLALLDSQGVCAQLQTWMGRTEPSTRTTRRPRVPRRKI